MAALLTGLLLLGLTVGPYDVSAAATTHPPAATSPTPPTAEERIKELETVTEALSRQMMLQQLYVEEQARSAGDSGIKQIRYRMDGSKPYYSATWGNTNGVAAVHDHADHIHTVGLGELIAVLNGVEFRTRHNDYKLVKPSTTTGNYHATEDIPFPEVPPAVLNKTTVDEQIKEMRQWFLAWRNGDHRVRDYRPYFPSLLCYLEGAWTTDTKNIIEPFASDRHSIDASSWFDLQEKIRFTSYTGDKSNLQNFAYLPTTILNVTNGVPVFAQWNFRILCHPTKSYVERKELKPVEALGTRMARKITFDQYYKLRTARFTLGNAPYSVDHRYRISRLDKLMAEIPGKDNYGANITDTSFGATKYEVKLHNNDPEKVLNAANYHRWYRLLEKGAMGDTTAHRGFADRNLFVAETTQPRVAPMSVTYGCHNVGRGPHRHEVCRSATQRVSYAIPLEIVYLTPLQAWNPYNVEYKGDWRHADARHNGRNGNPNPGQALNGTDSKGYYLTPGAFFTGADVDRDPADTARGSAGVLDREGNMHILKASGVRVLLPTIPDVGLMRTRYPIMPAYAEGSAIWKELEAMRDMLLDMNHNLKYFRTPPGTGTASSNDQPDIAEDADVYTPTTFALSPSDPHPVGLHGHTIELSEEEYRLLTELNQPVTTYTSEENGHSHLLQIRWDSKTGKLRIVSCDGHEQCQDGHTTTLEREVDHLHQP